MHFCQDLGYRNGMGNVGFATQALLALMRFSGEQIGLIDFGNLVGFEITLQQFA